MKVLNVGDFIDACDYRGKWCAARVEWICHGPHGRAGVHFLGHGKIFDEEINASMISSRIADLYTHSVDRRNWKIGDVVKYHFRGDTWLKVPITEVDLANNSVEIQIPSSEVKRCNLPHSVCEAFRWRSILSNDLVPYTEPSLKRTHDDLSNGISAIFLEAPPAKVTKPSLLERPSSSLATSWLTPLLRDCGVSEAHIKQCEDALVRDEGFTEAALYAELAKETLTEYLTKIGITAKGVQLKLVALRDEL